MNLLEINVFILRFQSEIWNDVAMKLLFSSFNSISFAARFRTFILLLESCNKFDRK